MSQATRVRLDDFNDVAAATLEGGSELDGPVLIDFREVQIRNVEWLDRPYLPRGELVLNIANGGTGKGLVSVYYAAKLSRGEIGGEARMSVFAAAEDAFDTVFKPRLLAAGADLAYVRGLRWRRRGLNDAFVIPDDLDAAERLIGELDAALFVIDPLLSHLHGKTDSHKDHEVKRALTPLGDLAHRTGCTVVGNHHFRKDTSRGARNAAQASSAFTDVPRVTWGMAKDPEDESSRVLEVLKSNIGPEGIGRTWRIQLGPVVGLDDDVPLILPEGVSRRSIDDLLRSVGEGRRVASEALRELVLRELAHGERSREYLDEVASDELGATKNALYERALVPLKTEGRIKVRKAGQGGWLWQIT